jgi:serine protease Do
MAIIDELRRATEAVVESSGSAVVRIGGGPGRGTGIVIGEGTVLTSAHNLRGEETRVTFPDGRLVTAEVKGADADGDLAVLGADTDGATPIVWGEPPSAAGAVVWALALPPGCKQPRVTLGTVSSVGRSFRGPRGRLITDALEHTSRLGRGSSGGPLTDGEGRLIGINTHRLGDGFYLALPASEALRARVEALSRGEVPVRRRLGVGLAPPHVARRLRQAVGLEPRDGVLVREVAEGGPAGAAGVRKGDLIVEAGGREVSSVDDLVNALDSVGEAGTLVLKVLRANDEVELTVRFERGGVDRSLRNLSRGGEEPTAAATDGT